MTALPVVAAATLTGADVRGMDIAGLRRALATEITGEVRFDTVSRALYSTDASVYQIEPLGVVVPRSRDDLIRLVGICAEFRCPITMRGGGTSQAGQAIGAGLIVDTSKYLTTHPRAERRRSAGRASSRASCSTS